MANPNTTRTATRKGNGKGENTVAEIVNAPAIVAELPALPMAGPSTQEAEFALFQQQQALTIKGCSGNTQKAKPQRKMLRRIAKMGVHPGTGLGIKRWHLYREGMTIQQAKTTPGLCYLDITFWEKNGLVEMRECTDQEYAAELAAWEASKPKVQAEPVAA